MQVKQVSLTNFRNYPRIRVGLALGKSILIGENAQGKSNFLEAIELAGAGRSARTSHDQELIRWGADHMRLEVVFERQGVDESVAILLQQPGTRGSRSLNKQVLVNGVSQSSVRSLLGRLVTVSFKSQDLNLLRGGPKFRREWIDSVVLRLRPAFQEILSSYQKVIGQRNRLLKHLFEKGRITVSDQDQLLAWDRQLGRFGSQIIKERLKVLTELLPAAQTHQNHLSGQREALEADYLFRAPDPQESEENAGGPEPDANEGLQSHSSESMSAEKLCRAEEKEVAQLLVKLLKERRAEEIGRRQSIIGPHRDDINFRLNNVSAATYASQGQQRSLVLSIKLAELARITDELQEAPILLLDDVLAELDASRQALIMSAVHSDTQTIITTTHLAGFQPEWLAEATIFSVQGGSLCELKQPV